MPTFAEVRAMKRPELQALCKEIGEKANGKTDALLLAVIKHFNLAETVEQAPAPAIKPTKAKKSSASASASATTTKSKGKGKATSTAPSLAAGDEDGLDEDDEMRLEAPAPVKAASKKTTSGAPKAAKVRSVEAPPTESTTPAAESRVYATSPATKATIATLLSTVKTLQSELTTARSALGKLESAIAALPARSPPRSPALQKSKVLSIVDAKIAEFRAEISTSFDQRVNSVVDQIAELKATLPAPTNIAEDEAIKTLVAKFEAQVQSTNSWKGDIEQAIVSLRSDVSTRVAALEARDAQAAASPSPRPTTPITIEQQVQVQASPTFSDAPPIQTLASFSSPTSSRVGSPAPASRNDSPALAPASTRRSPRKVPSNNNLPALALPSHMVAHASPARSPRGRGSPADVQPESPARPTASSIGKHARCSDASDISVAIETVRSPPSAPASSLAGVMASASREGGHIRKRMRVSNGSIIDHGEDVAADSTFASAEDGETSFEETSQMLDEGASSFIGGSRDFVVQTKTGDEPPIPLSISTAPSTSDPSFFSFGASLPPHSPAPSDARKSLPMASLPFPIVSPFAAPRTSKSVHGTPASAARKQLFGHDLSNKRMAVPPTPPAAKTLYGSEREMFGDGDDDVLEGSRFEDVGDVSPRKPSWGGGLFGRA